MRSSDIVTSWVSKHDTCWTHLRWSVDALFTQCFMYLWSSRGLEDFRPWMKISDDAVPHGASSAIASSRLPSRVWIVCNKGFVVLIPSMPVGYSHVSSEQSNSSSPSRCFTRSYPNGEKMLNSVFLQVCSKTESASGSTSTALRHLYSQQVCRLMFVTFTKPCHEAGFMWSTLDESSLSKSFVIAGSFKWRGEQSQSGCMARMAATPASPEERLPSCKISTLESIQTAVRIRPKKVSSQSVPSWIIKSFP